MEENLTIRELIEDLDIFENISVGISGDGVALICETEEDLDGIPEDVLDKKPETWESVYEPDKKLLILSIYI